MGKQIVFQINKTIRHYFPDLKERLNQIEEVRTRTEYEMAELITGGIALFLFKEKSRNAFNLDRKEAQFRKNYFRLFRMNPPHMDTVEDLFRLLNENELEQLKAGLIRELIHKKVFHKFKFLGKNFTVAVDATGVVTYQEQHCPHCLTKKYGDKTVYFHYVLEAKLVTSNGLAISLATEWINNSQDVFDKQDCEQKAFKRIAVKLKKYFPRLPICIVADGLYPNKPFFDICIENRWNFIVNFKDGNLKTIQEEINLLPERKKVKLATTHVDKTTQTQREYNWLNEIDYNKITIHWIACKETVKNIKTKEETTTQFVFLTNIKIDTKIAQNIVYTGRLRWKIENEGFNTQKNHDYALEHKYTRASFNAMKNFYQCLQIAHLINQLVVLSESIEKLLTDVNKLTIKHLWKRLIAFMLEGEFSEKEVNLLDIGRIQIRLA